MFCLKIEFVTCFAIRLHALPIEDRHVYGYYECETGIMFLGTRIESCKLRDEDVNAKIPVEDNVNMRFFAMAAVETTFVHLSELIWA